MPQTTRYPRRWRWPNDCKIALSVAIAFEAFELKSQYGIYSEPEQRAAQFHLVNRAGSLLFREQAAQFHQLVASFQDGLLRGHNQ